MGCRINVHVLLLTGSSCFPLKLYFYWSIWPEIYPCVVKLKVNIELTPHSVTTVQYNVFTSHPQAGLQLLDSDR